jgi:two-component system phosphate regulon response regulator OmpR
MSSSSGLRAEPLPDDAPHVLIVDDDFKIRDLLARYLYTQGFRVTTAADAEMAKASLRGLDFDIVLLDWMMPGISGIDLARQIKSQRDIPICMLTARAEPEQRIEGLEVGVDDYVSKPFEPRELLLRIKNILRRGQTEKTAQAPQADEVRMGTLVFHIARGELRRNNETIKLTERERDLLRQFAQKRGVPIQRYELATDDTTGNDRAIDVQINRLRRKIETDPSNPVYLQTVRGKGYILYAD